MDLTTAGIITGAVGFIVGSFLVTIIFLIVTGAKKSKLKKESVARHEIIGSIGKKCAEIDHAYSEFRIGKIPFESLGAMILEKIEDVSTELNSNSDILDAFYIKNIERFLQDQKSYLMKGVSSPEGEDGARSVPRPSSIEAFAEINTADVDSGVHEISAEIPHTEETFSVEPADEAEEFHIEEESSIEPDADLSESIDQPATDSAFNEPSSTVNMGEEAAFDINATTVLSVDEIQGAINNKEPEIESAPASTPPPSQPSFVEEVKSFESYSLEGPSLLNEEASQQTFESPVSTPSVPPTPEVAPAKPPVPEQPISQNQQPFVDMDATQVFDQSMFQVPGDQQQAPMQPIAPQNAPKQFEQPIPEPPAPVQPQQPTQSQAMPQQPAFSQAPQNQTPPPPQQSLSAFDVEATQEFHVSDIIQQAQQQNKSEEEVFEVNMPNPPVEKPKPTKSNDMVSGDDVANQMDNFFGFD